ncbi:13718_t:CDS:2 [Gigaspora margarita]|uniref:Mic17p n=2 Tax=Gigaspora margarita TaxID=4874 RepID=A0A8H3XFS6_GIGMA|nr:Mic17p [Gigaspora margarita]CAG8802431.1 13718_t:CDS:2 [Gigaspora margarita]
MPRRSSRSAPARAPSQQKRKASTLPPRSTPVPVTQTKLTQPNSQASNVPAVSSNRQPSLLGQVASTAAGVAIGHNIGHGISSLFSGGSSDEPPAQDTQSQYSPQTQYEQPQYRSFQFDDQSTGDKTCEQNAKALSKCLEQNNYNTNLCQWYLENLKACQQMASQL